MRFSWTLPLLLSANGCAAAWKERHVDLVMNIDDYYDQANSVDSYTMVEYTTQWCHHCKTLKPIFRDLMLSYDDDEGKLPIKFLDLSCEVFNSHKVCTELTGFPQINFIVPRDEPLVLHEPDYTSMPFYQRWWTRFRRHIQDPKWQLDKERVYGYSGNRDVESMRNFIETIRSKHEVHRLALRVTKPEYDCNDENDEQEIELCQLGQNYARQLDINNLDAEESRLENLIANNNEDQLKTVKFQLEIVKLLKPGPIPEKTEENVQEHDEL
ncbi:hypothetical protein ZYGR_0H00930 [Zygosaccharomyces rouxii]|uniref:ZYRO0B06094p n=2 Tax=Zygosaccharomyces rouxii TaxID=4956 RepID=C5DR73_ZYGRC|nr:uncharacterized protein ZYRO0B06094g [Zygosaccharomyces rouxii]KAH9200171.1 hypothetical protein LQ764DRAFT_113679 [Zygosaccharomyces rouxii]GAV47252.1 hypothetical protein ZYGR_0H00930 [Zygosaccharomyces rouxii]CAR26284.1 ZYRO0B06094p [Zygosaccharomyces rouxii]